MIGLSHFSTLLLGKLQSWPGQSMELSLAIHSSSATHTRPKDVHFITEGNPKHRPLLSYRNISAANAQRIRGRSGGSELLSIFYDRTAAISFLPFQQYEDPCSIEPAPSGSQVSFCSLRTNEPIKDVSDVDHTRRRVAKVSL